MMTGTMHRRTLIAGAAATLGPTLWLPKALAKGAPEKPKLKVGFIALIDCAPLVIARERGFFERHGLDVELSKEESWASVREGLITGRLDASHALAGTPLAVQLGAEGKAAAPLITAMSLDLNGNAITFSKRLWQAGVRSGADLKKIIATGKAGRTLTGAMVSASSMYNYNLCYWLAHHDIHPYRDVRLITLTPAQLIANLEAGNIDFFCVTEPWNSRAHAEGAGFTVIADRDVWGGHPEKVLAVMEPWARRHPNTHLALVKALIEACRYCDEPAHRQEVLRTLSPRTYLAAQPFLLEPALSGRLDFGGFDGEGRATASLKDVPDFVVFFKRDADYLVGNDQATFPWKSHGLWILTQMARWGQIPAIPAGANTLLDRVYRVDIYRQAAAELGLKAPAQDYKSENTFIDRRRFDPSNPVAYLDSFEIAARA